MNYFEYFSEIEERFVARRGSLLLLSTLDWALIETWREAQIPLVAVLRGIDNAFDKHEQRKTRAKGRLARVNGLAWCAQAVMEAATELAEASVGRRDHTSAPAQVDTGFETERVTAFLEGNAGKLDAAGSTHPALKELAQITAARLRGLAESLRKGDAVLLDELDRTLTVLEERLHAGLLASIPEEELAAIRGSAERTLAAGRAKIGAVQLRQLRDQLVQRELLMAYKVPRLSLFHMPMNADTDEPFHGQPDA